MAEENEVIQEESTIENVMQEEAADEPAQFEGFVGIQANLDENIAGHVVEVRPEYAKTRFRLIREMSYDVEGLAFNGFVYSAASWAAQLAINKEYLISVASKVNFLSPVKIGDIIDFEANALFSESKKQDVKVIGCVNDIRVFEGTFSIIILEDHILKIQKRQVEKQAKDSRELRAKLKAAE